MFVLPKPFRILVNVPDIYKNGQTKDSARIWPATELFLNSISPKKSAKQRKKNIHMIPNKRHISNVRLKTFLIRELFLLAWASEIEGSSREDAAPVIALGNKIRGSAIPEKTP